MKQVRMKPVGGHIEVYDANGMFLFSADNYDDAWDELREEQVSAA